MPRDRRARLVVDKIQAAVVHRSHTNTTGNTNRAQLTNEVHALRFGIEPVGFVTPHLNRISVPGNACAGQIASEITAGEWRRLAVS